MLCVLVFLSLVLGYIFESLKKAKFEQPSQDQVPEEDGSNDDMNMRKKQTLSPNEQIKLLLHKLGFIPEEYEDCLTFTFEGIHMVLNYLPDDMLSIRVPNILQVNEGSKLVALHIADRINDRLKYVKAYLWKEESLELVYERQWIENEKVEESLIGNMVMALANAYYQAGELIDKEYGKDE